MIRLKTSSIKLGSLLSLLLLNACDRGPDTSLPEIRPAPPYTGTAQVCSHQTPTRKALFGDLHVHTTYSFDAFAYGIQTTPADAYRFAKGESIAFLPLDDQGKMTGRSTIDRPLDFLAVTDHAEFLGEWQLCTDTEGDRFNSDYCATYRRGGQEAIYMTGARLALGALSPYDALCPRGDPECSKASETPWKRIIEAAEHANDATEACTFSAFVGYEHTGSPLSSNYHRNVIFRNDAVPSRPIGYFEAPNDYQLWAALDRVCAKDTGCDYLTIPHNSNLSNGRLLVPYVELPDTDTADGLKQRTQYTQTRLAREPLMEIFQHKGNSECANGFPNILGEPDELCEMEQIRFLGKPGRVLQLAGSESIPFLDNPTRFCEAGEVGLGGLQGNGCMAAADFYRTGLLLGLKEWQDTGMNPVKLGAIASTDTHMSTAGAVREDQWRGHTNTEWNREGRLSEASGVVVNNRDGNPGGLAGIWATENSRDAIFEAMKRRETFGTSGPRIQPRLFASWDYPQNMCRRPDMLETAYDRGVPIGADMHARVPGQKPQLLALAKADPAAYATPLQKLQIIKGWIDAEGAQHYRVFDVAGDQEAPPKGTAHQSLCALFEDPAFNPTEPSYYYLRAVEHPSPRWSRVDCLSYADKAGEANEKRPEICQDPRISGMLQEQAWTSPIWYHPN